MMNIINYGPLTLSLNESNDTLTITSCDKEATEVVLPEYIDGKPVVGIGAYAFEDCKKLLCVKVPNDGESFLDYEFMGFEIGDQAFSGCTSLKDIDIPHGISMLGHGAFRNCVSLESIYLPRCYISPYAFSGCVSLKEINPTSCISEGVFSHCKSLSVFPLLDSTTAIEADAFEHCYALTEIVIPASVRRIEPLAFRSCYGLKEVIFADPDNWYGSNKYTRKEYSLDLGNPRLNAERLSRMDFDDGCRGWYKKIPGISNAESDFEAKLRQMDEEFFAKLSAQKDNDEEKKD